MAGFGDLIGGILGGAVGALGGPVGIAGGSAIGSALGGAIGDWFSSDDDGPPVDASGLPAWSPGAQPPGWQTGGTGLAFGGGSSGGGGAGSTFDPNLPAIPTQPGGGMQGPIYGAQALPAAAQTALSTALAALRAYPYISDLLQRYWDFPSETQVTAPKSQALWTALAGQLPKGNRAALYQFLVGFPSPIGLSKAESDIFFTLKIAEAGYTPTQICCTEGK